MKYNHLKHLDIADYYQFITFRTRDSRDSFLKKLHDQKKAANKKQLEIDNYLDQSKQGAYLNDEALIYLNSYLREADSRLYVLSAFAIMPNHVHLLVKPLLNLASMMQRLKGGSANKINQILEKSGSFWEADYYDKAIRDEKHYQIVYNYIQNNPLKLIGNSEGRFYGVHEN